MAASSAACASVRDVWAFTFAIPSAVACSCAASKASWASTTAWSAAFLAVLAVVRASVFAVNRASADVLFSRAWESVS